MSKSLKRDIQLLAKIMSNIKDIKDTFVLFDCDFSQTRKGLCNNKPAFDLCSFYMAQIGEKLNLLTESSKVELTKVIPITTYRRFRKIIDHDYDNVNKLMLSAFIQNTISQLYLDALKERYKYCLNHTKKS